MAFPVRGKVFWFWGQRKGAGRIGISRTGDFEIYAADIRQPRKASLMAYKDTSCWITLADSEGAETTIFVNLDDEGDREFVVQLRLVADVLAVLMSEDEGEEVSGHEPA